MSINIIMLIIFETSHFFFARLSFCFSRLLFEGALLMVCERVEAQSAVYWKIVGDLWAASMRYRKVE